MPSDAKKKEMARKKELAKARSGGKKGQVAGKPEGNGEVEKEKTPPVQNGTTNGNVKEISAEGE